jgi:hypothetical protein
MIVFSFIIVLCSLNLKYFMKKIILTALVAVCGVFAMSAQATTYGAKVAYNSATVSDTDDAEEDVSSKPLSGFSIGAYAEISLSDAFSIQPEVLYSTKGVKGESSEAGQSLEVTMKLSYIDIPVMAKYYVTKGFSLEVGPQVSFLLAADGESAISEGDDSVTVSVDIKDSFESVDFGLNMGAGYKLDSGLNFGLRYGLGLATIVKESGDDSPKNNVFSLSAGYSF